MNRVNLNYAARFIGCCAAIWITLSSAVAQNLPVDASDAQADSLPSKSTNEQFEIARERYSRLATSQLDNAGKEAMAEDNLRVLDERLQTLLDDLQKGTETLPIPKVEADSSDAPPPTTSVTSPVSSSTVQQPSPASDRYTPADAPHLLRLADKLETEAIGIRQHAYRLQHQRVSLPFALQRRIQALANLLDD